MPPGNVEFETCDVQGESSVPTAMVHCFGEVLTHLQMSNEEMAFRAYRLGWNGADQYIYLQQPDAHSKMKQPYIYIESDSRGVRVPWLASQTDMLAHDWIIENVELR